MMTPEQKVAALMMFLGEERAAALLSSLPKDVARRVLNAIGRLGTVDEETVSQVVKEVLALCKDQPKNSITTNGKKVLEAASRALNDPSLLSDFSADFSVGEIREDLANVRANLLANWLQREQPQVVAVVLSIASPQKSAEIFKLLPENLQMQTCLAIAGLNGVETDTIDLIYSEVRRLRNSQASEVADIGGFETVTKLMQNLPPDLRNNLLTKIEETSPDLSQKIKAQIISPELLTRLLPADLAKLCGGIRDPDLLLVLRVESQEIREKFLGGVSKNRKETLLEQLDHMPPQRKSEVDAARAKLVDLAVSLHKNGSILFPWEDKLV